MYSVSCLAVPDDAEAKATSLFRNQLLSPPQVKDAKVAVGGGEVVTHVNIVHKEPRVSAPPWPVAGQWPG